MQVLDAYPAYAVGGSCLVTKSYDVSGGKKVISLDVDVHTLPSRGVICLSEEAVQLMCVALGWDTDQEGFAKRAAQAERIAELEKQNADLQAALESVVSAQKVAYQVAPNDKPGIEPDVAEEVVLGEPLRPDPPFDPSEHTIDEVKAHVEADPGDREAVLRAERVGKNRVTLIDWLES